MKPSFEYIVEHYINLVYYFTRSWVKDEYVIDDVVHDTFLKAFRSYKIFKYTSEGEFKRWLLTICRNCIFDRQKKKKFISLDNSVIDLMEAPDDVDAWLQAEIDREDLQRIIKEIEKLSDLDNVLVRLRIFDELEFKDIAEILENTEAAVKMRFYRVIAKLQKKLV